MESDLQYLLPGTIIVNARHSSLVSTWNFRCWRIFLLYNPTSISGRSWVQVLKLHVYHVRTVKLDKHNIIHTYYISYLHLTYQNS
jgi:hypothetical protein